MSRAMTVIGTGYLGATHAACMADLGYQVLGVDVSQEKVDALNSGRVPFYEPGLDEVLQRALASGRLRFTTSFAEAAEFADAHFICVGTPQLPNSHQADLRQVNGAVDALLAHIPDGAPAHTFIGKSTVPVGTAAELAQRSGSKAEVCWCPEFLREGFAVEDTLHPDRLVFGVTSNRAEQVLREIFAPQIAEGVPVVVTDLPTAELVKVSANAFLATKISFINAIAEVCEATGADVTQLADAIGFDDRIGRKFLGAGVGFGGGCLPKDIRGFMARAEELSLGHSVGFLREVDEINLRRRQRVIELSKAALDGTVRSKKITVLGATFKPNSDDIRDSPALAIASALHAAGAFVTVHDPKGLENASRSLPELGYAEKLTDAVADAQLLLHLTEWQEYRAVDPAELGELVAQRHIIDGRNALDGMRWAQAGWAVDRLGRPSIAAHS